MHPAQLARWVAENVGDVDVIIEADGSRTVREAAPIIAANLDWLRPRHPDMIRPDGTLVLDSAGEYRYRWVRDIDGPFAAYEQM